MVVVTRVSSSRSSRYAHVRQAMSRDLSQQEVNALLGGDVAHATVEDAPALFFAQHCAERRGQPDAEVIRRLVDACGSQGARDVISYVRLITAALTRN